MPGVQPRFGYPGLKISYTCAEAILGGQLVELRSGTRTVGVAAAGSVVCAGVALHDVPASRATVQGPAVGDGFELTVITNVVIAVTFAAAATRGQRLIVAASGQVTPAGATPDARTVVGWCFDDSVGIGNVGLMRVTV